MLHTSKRICALLLALALLLPGAGLAQGNVYASQLIQQMENHGYKDFLAAEPYVKGYDAAVVAMDACSASGPFYNAMLEATEGYRYVSTMTRAGQADSEIILLYAFDDEAWEVTADAADFTLTIRCVMDANHTLSDEECRQIAAEIADGEMAIDGEIFWLYFMHIYVVLTGGPVEESDAPKTTGTGAGDMQWQAKNYPMEDGKSVRIDLQVDMEITEDMTDFFFRVNGSEIIEAHANPNVGTVTGRYTATRNGLYVFELGFTLRGEETFHRIEVNVDNVKEEAQPPHEHAFILETTKEHPHVSYACECGEAGQLPVVQGPGATTLFEDMECCLCGHHEWGMPVKQKNGGYKIYCQRDCAASQAYTLREAEEMTQAILEMEAEADMRREYLREDGTTGNTAHWRGVAAQATGKLTRRGFTLGTEAMESFSDISGSMAKAAGLSAKEDYDALMVSRWESLLVEMLTSQEPKEKSVFETVGFIAGAGDVMGTVDESWDDWGTLLDDTKLGEGIEDVFDAISKKTGIEIEFDPDEKSKNTEMFGYCMNMISAMKDGLDAASEARQLYEDFEEMVRQYETSMPILSDIIAAARASGNERLEEAALNVKERLDAQTAEKISYVLTVTGESLKAVGKSTLEWGSEEIFKEVAKHIAPGADDIFVALGIMEDIAGVTKWLVDWGDAYETAQDLMLLQDMNNSLDIYSAINETDSVYLADLWLTLQLEGAEKAKEFLVEYEDGFGLNVKQLGIEDLDAMLSEIDETKKTYEGFTDTLEKIREKHAGQ